MKKILKENRKVILAFILGMIFTATTGVVAYSVYANTVTYDNTGSGLQSTDVQGALDELYGITNNMMIIDPDTFQRYSDSVYASKFGVFIMKEGQLNYFRVNNWNIEKEHIRQVFSDDSCSVSSDEVSCGNLSKGSCTARSNGYIFCGGYINKKGCSVNPDGSVHCD